MLAKLVLEVCPQSCTFLCFCTNCMSCHVCRQWTPVLWAIGGINVAGLGAPIWRSTLPNFFTSLLMGVYPGWRVLLRDHRRWLSPNLRRRQEWFSEKSEFERGKAVAHMRTFERTRGTNVCISVFCSCNSRRSTSQVPRPSCERVGEPD